MDSTIRRVALQCFTDDVEVLLNVAINKKVTIIVRRMINASLSVQYLCTKIRVEKITSFVGSVPVIVLQLFLCLLFCSLLVLVLFNLPLVKPKEWDDSHKRWISTKK